MHAPQIATIDVMFPYPSSLQWRDSKAPEKEKIVVCANKKSEHLQETSLVDPIVGFVRRYLLQAPQEMPEKITARFTIAQDGKIACRSVDHLFQSFVEKNSIVIHRQSSGTLSVDLSIHLHMVTKNGGGLTTNSIRFPHLYQSIFQNDFSAVKGRPMRVCLVGPGLYETQGQPPDCPMLAELLSLMPKAKIVVLEKDRRVVSILKEDVQKKKSLIYDSGALRMRMLPHPQNPCRAPDSYLKVFHQMIGQMAQWGKTESGDDVRQMLLGQFAAQKICIKLSNPSQIDVREFDINTAEPDSEVGEFDLMVATKVLSLALLDCQTDFIFRFAKMLSALKTEGIFYLDEAAWKLIKETSRFRTENDLMNRLTELVGYPFEIAKIPVPDFKDIQKDVIICMRADRLDIVPTVTTGSLVMLKKRPKKK